MTAQSMSGGLTVKYLAGFDKYKQEDEGIVHSSLTH